jgi:hypothetical protein
MHIHEAAAAGDEAAGAWVGAEAAGTGTAAVVFAGSCAFAVFNLSVCLSRLWIVGKR